MECGCVLCCVTSFLAIHVKHSDEEFQPGVTDTGQDPPRVASGEFTMHPNLEPSQGVALPGRAAQPCLAPHLPNPLDCEATQRDVYEHSWATGWGMRTLIRPLPWDLLTSSLLSLVRSVGVLYTGRSYAAPTRQLRGAGIGLLFIFHGKRFLGVFIGRVCVF